MSRTEPSLLQHPPGASTKGLGALSCIQGWGFFLLRVMCFAVKPPARVHGVPRAQLVATGAGYHSAGMARATAAGSTRSHLICMNVMLINMKGEMQGQEQLVRQPLPQPQPLYPRPLRSPPAGAVCAGPRGGGIRDQISPANSLHWCCKPGFSPGGGCRVTGAPSVLQDVPPQLPMGSLSRQLWGWQPGMDGRVSPHPKGTEGCMGHVPSVPSPGHVRGTAIPSAAAAARKPWLRPRFLRTAL